MKRKLKSRRVVLIGGGLTAALVARKIVDEGVDVLVLERLAIARLRDAASGGDACSEQLGRLQR